MFGAIILLFGKGDAVVAVVGIADGSSAKYGVGI